MDTNHDELFITIGNMSSDGYFTFDTNTNKFSYLNEGITPILEIDKQQLSSTPSICLQQVHPEDRKHAISCYEECLQDMAPKKYEIRLQFSAHREKYIRCSIFPIQNNGVVSLCGIVEDTTIDRHNKTHIEQINARKNATLEILSHDLKEPLALMKLMASSIKDDIEKTGDQRLVDSLQFITQMCERNMKLVRSIINHEFLKSSIIELKRERVDIVWEIHDVIRTYRKSHLRELKDFRFESSSDKIYLYLDTMKFMQVINNLISNALKFTELGGVIAIKVQEKEKTVLVTVSDNGIGIPDELKPKLFDKGGEALRPGLSGEESGGLGMSIIKSIVELHRGEIWFESEEGQGTTFYISLPKVKF